ncbi:hypothetical protein [Flavobacterium sp. W20_MBD1_R3]|uniref:hypothetical protein n=1 Tax=Flavobacterium sp. W20_MBD1_R3 TaxID=3240278 RepID=UPI003F8EA67E
MKKMRWVISVLLLFVFIPVTEAQILKKFQKKVQDKVERKVGDTFKNDQEELFDKSSAIDTKAKVFGKNKVDPSLLPNSYVFSWKYSLEIQSENQKTMIMDYFLERDVDYFGFRMGESDEMFMIIDSKNKWMITTFNQERQKVAMVSKMIDYSEMGSDIIKDENDVFSYKSLPNKTIMGYNCKGIEAASADFLLVFYYTNEAQVSFSELFKSEQKQKVPNVLQRYFKTGEKPLLMAMSMKDLKDKGKVTTMNCIFLEKTSFVFAKADYKFM